MRSEPTRLDRARRRVSPINLFEPLESRVLLSTSAATAALNDAVAAAVSSPAVTVAPSNNFFVDTTSGEKPQSKLWNYDNHWWGVMADSTGSWVWRLDGATWSKTLQLSSSTTAKADVESVGNVTHVLLYDGVNTQLASIQEVQGPAPTYIMWRKRPSLVNIALPSGGETATMQIDSTGRMWVAYDNANSVNVIYADGNYSSFSSNTILASGIDIDDICAISNVGTNQVGVFWSNQVTHQDGFMIHSDTAAPGTWSADEVPTSTFAQAIGNGIADDHIHMVSGQDGTLYVAAKTSYDTAGQPEIVLFTRAPAGTWSMYTVDTVGTRPTLMLDPNANTLTVLYTNDNLVPKQIVEKTTSLSSINFSGAATTVISGGGATWNDVSTTKQLISGKFEVIATNQFALVARGESVDNGVAVVNPLPSDWNDTDIGDVGAAGSAHYNDGFFTVSGAGAGIGGTQDSGNFAYITVDGNFTLQTKVESFSAGASGAQAGLMVRDGTDSKDFNASLFITPGNGAIYENRGGEGGDNTSTATLAGPTAPQWLRFVRIGDEIDSYVSADNVTYTQVWSAHLNVPVDTLQIGLGVSSHDTTTAATAVFSNVGFTPQGLPNSMQSSDIGTVGQTGGALFDGGKFSVDGAGTGFGGTADSGQFTYKAIAGNFTLVARLDSFNAANPAAQAGLALRDSIDPAAFNASIFITPGNGAVYQNRGGDGSGTATASLAGPIAPEWLKLVRTGNQIDSFVSSDGSTYTQVWSAQLNVPVNALDVGLAVSSHNTGQAAQAVFSNVAFS